MGIIGTAVKVGVLAKLVQVARREASKPENRKRIADATDSLKQRSGAARRTGT